MQVPASEFHMNLPKSRSDVVVFVEHLVQQLVSGTSASSVVSLLFGSIFPLGGARSFPNLFNAEALSCLAAEVIVFCRKLSEELTPTF